MSLKPRERYLITEDKNKIPVNTQPINSINFSTSIISKVLIQLSNKDTDVIDLKVKLNSNILTSN